MDNILKNTSMLEEREAPQSSEEDLFTFPLRTQQEVDELEAQLQDSEKKKQLVRIRLHTVALHYYSSLTALTLGS